MIRYGEKRNSHSHFLFNSTLMKPGNGSFADSLVELLFDSNLLDNSPTFVRNSFFCVCVCMLLVDLVSFQFAVA